MNNRPHSGEAGVSPAFRFGECMVPGEATYAKTPGSAEAFMPDTNAIKWLRTQGVSFEILTYTFSEVGADLAAEAVGRPLETCCKTLIVKAAGPSFYVAIVPGDQRFDTRKMAAAVGVRSADLADAAEAEKITGYHIGGISPFALRRKLPTLIEESLLALDTIIVNGGQRGTLIELDTQAVIRLLDARPADLCG